MTFSCAETFRRLQDYLDRELSPAETAAVEAHLAECGVCAEEYRFEASVLRHVRRGVEEPVPAGLADSVLDRVYSDCP